MKNRYITLAIVAFGLYGSSYALTTRRSVRRFARGIKEFNFSQLSAEQISNLDARRLTQGQKQELFNLGLGSGPQAEAAYAKAIEAGYQVDI